MDEAQGFWQIWLCHRQRLFEQSLRRVGGNPADAEDALSTAMLRALESFPCQASRLFNVEAWFTRIVSNVCVDIHRARGTQAAADGVDEESSSSDWVYEAVPTPEQQLLQREQSRVLWSQIDALPPHLRQPCAMRFKQGMAYEDIAQELGLTPVNVRQRMMRSYRRLRPALEGFVQARSRGRLKKTQTE